MNPVGIVPLLVARSGAVAAAPCALAARMVGLYAAESVVNPWTVELPQASGVLETLEMPWVIARLSESSLL